MQAFIFSPLELEKVATQWIGFEAELDVAAATAGNKIVRGVLFAYGPCVLAGYPFVEAVCRLVECEVKWVYAEGTYIDNASKANNINIGSIIGEAGKISQIERICMELMARSGACATYARRCVRNAKERNPEWKGVICATRKTTPGAWGRLVEKYGALVGGAYPHRYDLSTLVYLDDNHIAMAGSTFAAVKKARALCGFSNKIEIECLTLEDAVEACKAGADMINLDHFTPDRCAHAAAAIKQQFPHVVIETGGRITDETVGDYALPHVDVVSLSAITKSPPSAKIHMKIDVDYARVPKL